MGDLARQRGRHARGWGSTGKGKDATELRHVQGENMVAMVLGQRACAGGEAGALNANKTSWDFCNKQGHWKTFGQSLHSISFSQSYFPWRSVLEGD